MTDSGNGKKQQRRALGRGLSALISSREVPVQPPHEDSLSPKLESRANLAIAPAQSTEAEDELDERVRYLPISQIEPNPSQPRNHFADEELSELAESIKVLGVLQPILIRELASSRYEIVAGERRWRAAQLAKLQEIPAIIREFDDCHALEVALVENIQRCNLNPVEEARAYQALIDDFSLAQQQVADRVGKNRASVSNYLRLLKLPPDVLDMVANGSLSMGHAKAILTVKEPAAQMNLAHKCLDENLPVRALEEIVSRVVVLEPKRRQRKTGKGNGAFPEITDRLRETLGTKVIIKHSKKTGRGKIEIEYYSEQELDRLSELLSSNS